MLISGPSAAEQAPPTAKQIYDRLVGQHEMTGVSYSTVRGYVAGRLPARPPAARNPGSSGDDAQQAITHLKELLEAIQPGTAASAQPHFDALELVIKQALAIT